MNKNSITEERVAQILSAYGADTARWPADERQAAQTFLQHSEPARRLYAEEEKLDAWLEVVPVPAGASAALHARIVDVARAGVAGSAAAAAMPAGSSWQRFKEIWAGFGAWRPVGAALAASLMLGVVFGGIVGPANAKPEPVDLVELALLNNTLTGY